MKKILFVIVCLVLLVSSMLPVGAASYVSSDQTDDDQYFALIPWGAMEVQVDGDTYFLNSSFDPYLTVDFEYSTPASPVWSPVEVDQTGYDYDPDSSSEYGVPTTLSYILEQTYSGEILSYQRATNYMEFKRDGQKLENFRLTTRAQQFVLTKMEYSAIFSGSKISLPAGVLCDVSVTVGYSIFDDSTGGWFYRTGRATKTIGDQGGGSYSFMPGSAALFEVSSLDPTEKFVVSFMTLTLDFVGAPGRFSIDMLYGDENTGVVALMTSKVAVRYEEKIVEVPADKLDLFSWIVEPVGKFFGIELFPGISLGGVVGVGVGVLLLAVFLKWFGGGG